MNLKNKYNEKKGNKMALLLNLDYFKIKKCNKSKVHNYINCCFYHNKSDRRRNLNIFDYNHILCHNSLKCEKKDKCKFSHNKIEILYHPNFYKKKFCKKFLLKGKCKYNKFCSFAHSEDELRLNLIHKLKINLNFFWFYFKTEFCPLSIIPHDMNLCVYSHNFQDLKRKNLMNKIPKACQNWDIYKNYNNYLDGCENGYSCKYLHGWKEILYHPHNYKKQLCNNNKNTCRIRYYCNFIHKNEVLNQNKFKQFFTM